MSAATQGPDSGRSDQDVRLLDPGAIQRLREWGGDPLLGRMIRLFLELGPDRMETLRKGLADRDLDALGSTAHSLKSSAANLGAERLRLGAATLEEACRRGEGGEVDQLVHALEEAFQETAEALRRVEPNPTRLEEEEG
jgi:HPt (histidine-containing phosphotransfer) domain-containing protein